MAEGGLKTAAPGPAELVQRATGLVDAIAARADETERLRKLHPDTVEDLQTSGLWSVFRPFRYGGSEGDFGLFVDIGEQLGRACTSTSWVWANLVSHNWMLGMWPERAQDEVWGPNPDARIGSATVYPPGKAEPVDGGYLLSGRWPFSSGIDVSHWIMLGGMVPPEDGEGDPKPHIFVVDCDDIEVIDTWDVAGLLGTGSHDVTCEKVFVPDYMALSPHDMRGGPTPGSAVNPASLYRLPLLGLFSHILAGCMLGAARGAFDHYTESMRTRVATFNRQRIGGPCGGPDQDRRSRLHDPRDPAAAPGRPAGGPRDRRGRPYAERRGEDQMALRRRLCLPQMRRRGGPALPRLRRSRELSREPVATLLPRRPCGESAISASRGTPTAPSTAEPCSACRTAIFLI